ncbi:hypothetical protein [Nonomuraea guangzhouensis]|uniref:Secreted protein n=1 Tax=Nonomuraea guangzhouensis TaxID=1291555 RepID=A0ABW4GKU7_9ACTN|nr:hypothetical protein [Nonomuraea guangzhouensis]
MRLSVLLTLGAVFTAGLLAVQPVASAQAAVQFYADSGDSCLRGSTAGTLDWLTGPVIRPTVKVDGYLSDDANLSPCTRDGMYSTAVFNAYNGTALVDSETAKADDAQVPLSFTLSDPAGVTAIDRVVVQVCRFSSSPIGISYCGKAAEYKMP